jgi:2-C-methyl-D-erythritol 4-phosphate cytidylyltransferase
MNSLLLVAGGSGSRVGGPVPKQYQEIHGRSILVHTLERFYDFDPHIKVVVVLARGHEAYWEAVSATLPRKERIMLAEGGSSRYHSVMKGLELIGPGEMVGIHDAVRPLVSQLTIQRSYEAARESGSGIPVVEMEESVRMTKLDGGSENLERARLRKVQTPQVFRSSEIKQAYAESSNTSFTDDASVYEACFGMVRLVEGNRENIKITSPADMKLATLIL